MPWLPCWPLLCLDFTCQLGVLLMVNLVYSFAAGKNSGSSSCPLPSPLAHEVSPAVLSPRQVNYVSTQLLCMEWESLKSGWLDLCSVWPHCSALLIRLSAEQSPPRIPQGGVETEHNPPTASWHLVKSVPHPHTPYHHCCFPKWPPKRKYRMTSPFSLSSLLLPTISWG